jgi:hypothetical protein
MTDPTPADLSRMLDAWQRETAAEHLARYRPELAAVVGQDIADRILDEPTTAEVAGGLCKSDDVAVEEVALAAAEYLRDHPCEDPVDALAAVCNLLASEESGPLA